MTFDEVLRQYCLKIGQSWGNMSEDLTTEALERVASSYWWLCSETGCTFKPLASVSLSAVTATTNKHELYTALSLTTGQEVFAVADVTWEGVHLARWTKMALMRPMSMGTKRAVQIPELMPYGKSGSRRTTKSIPISPSSPLSAQPIRRIAGLAISCAPSSPLHRITPAPIRSLR